MKKIKLFALAIMAMLSTNAFAQATEDATSLFKFEYTGTNATIIGFVVDPEAAKVKNLEIPATLPTTAATPGEVKVVAIKANAFKDNTQIETLTIADENVATINDGAFKGCTNLTTVTIGKAATTIGAAFAGCSKLATVTFNAADNAQTIAAGAFAGTAIETLNLTNTKVAAINDLFTDADNTTNAKLTTITIPASMTSIAGDAFNGCTKLATVNFVAATAAQTIGAAAFANTAIKSLDLTNTKVATLERVFTELSGTDVLANITLESVTLPATLTTIKTQAFHSCAKLSSVDLSACEGLTTLENFVFGTTPSLTALDFSACAGLTISDTATPFIPSAGVKNNYLAEITLPEDLANIGVALANLPKLATVNISETSITKLIANALANSELITALELPEECVTIASGALDGSKVATLTINGDIAANGVDAVATAAFTPLTTVIFNGDLTAAGAIKGGAFTYTTKLASVTFNGVLAAGAVASAAFKGAGAAAAATAGIKMTVTYQPADGDAGQAFDKEAFSDDAAAAKDVKLITTVAVYAAQIAYNATGIYRVNIIQSDAVSQDYELEVNAPEGSSFFYGKHYKAGDYKIKKEQDGATVIVYGAFVDESDGKIYMEQLHIVNGYYYIPGGEKVVVKSTSSAKVKVEKDDDGTKSSVITANGGLTNKINACDAVTIGATLIDDPANATYNLYAMAKPEKYGLQWKKFKATTTLPAGTFYVKVLKTVDAARLEVIWLDGSENEATAIKAVKSANAENGAIFNLAGQKVNASYKGVVIKDGKKYIQK